MRRTGLLAMLLILTAMVPAGCSGSHDPSAAPAPTNFSEPLYDWKTGGGQTLNIWCQERELNRSYMEKALNRYESSTGNAIQITEIPKDQFESAAAAALTSPENMPDLLLSYGGANIDAMNPDENFYDFTDAPWVKDLTDTSINQTIYHGRVIGLPHWEASISGTLYNKKIFKKYSIPIPKTQEEFLSACDQLLKNGVSPLYMPAAEVSMLLYQFPLDVLIEDHDTLNKLNNDELSYSDMPGMTAVVNWYRTMAERGYLGSHWQTDSWDGINEAMGSGEYAMMLCWDTWLYTDFDGDPASFGLMPAFIGVPENGTFEGPNLALLIANKNSPKLEEALNFITFMADPYNYNAAFEGIYTAPVFKHQFASISTPQYIEAERLIERNFRDSTAWLRIRGFSQMDAACIIDYMNSGGSMTASQCLEEMDRLRIERKAH